MQRRVGLLCALQVGGWPWGTVAVGVAVHTPVLQLAVLPHSTLPTAHNLTTTTQQAVVIPATRACGAQGAVCNDSTHCNCSCCVCAQYSQHAETAESDVVGGLLQRTSTVHERH